jgi:hypothetical protein
MSETRGIVGKLLLGRVITVELLHPLIMGEADSRRLALEAA